MIALDIDRAVQTELAKSGDHPGAGHGDLSISADLQGATARAEGDLGAGWSIGAYIRRLWKGPNNVEAAGTIKKEW